MVDFNICVEDFEDMFLPGGGMLELLTSKIGREIWPVCIFSSLKISRLQLYLTFLISSSFTTSSSHQVRNCFGLLWENREGLFHLALGKLRGHGPLSTRCQTWRSHPCRSGRQFFDVISTMLQPLLEDHRNPCFARHGLR